MGRGSILELLKFLLVTFPLAAGTGTVSLAPETEMWDVSSVLLQILSYLVIDKHGFGLVAEQTCSNGQFRCALCGGA